MGAHETTLSKDAIHATPVVNLRRALARGLPPRAFQLGRSRLALRSGESPLPKGGGGG